MLDEVLRWLTELPPVALYAALALTAAIENAFPPLPADTVVAFGAFLAARGDASGIGAFLATWIGNVAGAMAVYALGRRFGAAAVRERMVRFGGADAERRLEHLYAKRGLAALFLSRFLPGVRALVPPFAGALRVPAAHAATVIAVASGIWYGVVTVIAFRVGRNWEALERQIEALTRGAGLVATVLVTTGIVGWFIYRRLTVRRS